MKKWFVSLSLVRKTVIISLMIIFLAFLLTIPLFFNNLMEIPLGIVLGGGASVFSFALFAFTENIKNQKKSMSITIMLIVFMSIIHGLALTTSAVLYYAFNLHIFNVFATFSSLFIGLLVHVVLSFLPEKNNG